jgi:hypothetical protein
MVDWEMRSLRWTLILEGRKHMLRTLTSDTDYLLAITVGSGKKLYAVSECGGVQRVPWLSLLWPTLRQLMGYMANEG